MAKNWIILYRHPDGREAEFRGYGSYDDARHSDEQQAIIAHGFRFAGGQRADNPEPDVSEEADRV